jgi:uncharacterized membrane protein
MAFQQVSEKEMRAVLLKAVLPAWTSVVLLSFILRQLDVPGYVLMGVCFFIAVIMQSVLQARVFRRPRPRLYWILSGVLAVAGASASAWLRLQ